MLTIMIPTMNRSEFLIRQLDYYAASGYPHWVSIADSSNDTHRLRTQEAIERLKGKLKVAYYYLPNTNDYTCLKHLVDNAQTPYAAYCGDDDFFITPGVLKAVDFLEKDPSYSAVNGRSIIFVLGNSGAYGKVEAVGPYPQRGLEAEKPSARLTTYMDNYFTAIFGVHRIERWRTMYEKVHLVPDRFLGAEMLPCCMSAILGNVKHLECLYLARQAHDQRYALPKFYEWIIKPDWRESHLMVFDELAEALVKLEGLTKPDAEEIVKKMFLTYWALCVKQNNKFYTHKANTKNNLRAVLKRSKFLTQNIVPAMRKIRSRMNIKDEISIAAFLNPDSPYYQDFSVMNKIIDSKQPI